MAIHKHSHSHTLPSTPTHRRTSSDFAFIVSLSPPNSSTASLRPADELFYNGQLLPLHLSPPNSMVHTLLATAARHSSDYHHPLSYKSSASTHPISAIEDGNAIDCLSHKPSHFNDQTTTTSNQNKALINKQFSFNRFSSVFRKETKPAPTAEAGTVSLTQKIRKYMKKLSKYYCEKTTPPMVKRDDIISYSFSGNLRFLRKTSCVSSCPSTMPSSPYHSGVLRQKNVVESYTNRSSSSTEQELQSAIQGAIAHCKNSMTTT
ncbi:putative membrane-associated kinase regulator 1 [Bidens hawaiensis]|uniref:putative membrane-associated kinase regulator 1 n=1 Tax=Bidens hawaiensis TaxID=980011 RepID=UPI00404ACD32